MINKLVGFVSILPYRPSTDMIQILFAVNTGVLTRLVPPSSRCNSPISPLSIPSLCAIASLISVIMLSSPSKLRLLTFLKDHRRRRDVPLYCLLFLPRPSYVLLFLFLFFAVVKNGWRDADTCQCTRIRFSQLSTPARWSAALEKISTAPAIIFRCPSESFLKLAQFRRG